MIVEIQHTFEALIKGGLILYPTDTVWGIGCDATNPEAVERIYALKRRSDTKALICMVSDLNMLKKHVKEVPDIAFDIMAFADKPTTIIYDSPVGVSKNLIAADGSLGIRMVADEFCRKFIKAFGKPVVSTSANISGAPTPTSYKEISREILNGVDYVVNLHRDKKCNQPSAVLRPGKEGRVDVIRK